MGNLKNKHASGALKYQVIYQDLKDKILKGEFPQGTFLPPETVLARKMNVSTMTVVRALNELVKEHLIVRQRGVGTMVSNLQKKPLIPGRKLRIGVLWRMTVRKQDIDSTFEGFMTQGLIKRCELDDVTPLFTAKSGNDISRAIWSEPDRGIFLEVIGEPYLEHDGHPPIEEVIAGKFDGLILLSVERTSFIEQVLNLGLPTIIVDSFMECFADRADFVYADPQLGYYKAIEHFVKEGFKKIHFVGNNRWLLPDGVTRASWDEFKDLKVSAENNDSLLRLAAYRSAMDSLGMSVSDRWIHFAHHNASTRHILSNHLLSLPEEDRPEVIITENLGLTEYLIEKFAEMGFPLKAAVTASHKKFSNCLPIYLDAGDMGSTAIDLLLWRLQRPSRSFLNVGVRMKFNPSTL